MHASKGKHSLVFSYTAVVPHEYNRHMRHLTEAIHGIERISSRSHHGVEAR